MCINTPLVFGMFDSTTAANLSLAENKCVLRVCVCEWTCVMTL